MTVVVALGFALFDVVVPAPRPLPACPPACPLAMSVYFTCKQIAVPALRSEVCLLEACPQAVLAEEEHAGYMLCLGVICLSAGNDQRVFINDVCYQTAH